MFTIGVQLHGNGKMNCMLLNKLFLERQGNIMTIIPQCPGLILNPTFRTILNIDFSLMENIS